MATMIDQCEVHPSQSNDLSFSLPLTHFDIPFLTSDPTQRLIFFKFPCSRSHFHETIAPRLKKSLSHTLKHYFPLAGKVIVPFDSDKPTSRYVPGDSVSLTIKESCNQDLAYLTCHGQRVADEFYTCVPHLKPPRRFSDHVEFHVMAIQITLFADQGICIGITNHHAMSDESSTIRFVRLWAVINRYGALRNSPFIDDKSIFPSLDRTKAQEPDGLDSIAWNLVRKSMMVFNHDPKPLITFPINRVRATFVITRQHVQQLKRYALVHRPNLPHVSSFSVACAYIWSCLEKSDAEEAKHDEPVYFAFSAECRSRLNPPLPPNYFGNCIVFLIARARHGALKGNEGFLTAAGAIGEAIHEGVYNGDGILNSKHCPVDFEEFRGKRVISVAGSPRFDAYEEADFGWGKPEKHEYVHLDGERSFSFIKSKEFEGGFEVGLSRTKMEMDAFLSNFNQGRLVMESVTTDELVKKIEHATIAVR